MLLRLPLPLTALPLAACLTASAAEIERSPGEPKALPAPDQPMKPVQPAIERIDADHYRVGGITLNHKTREIRLPAEVNMNVGLLEFVLVHTKGKVHESLFLTDMSATHLNLALKLLRYQPSRELYRIPNETGGLTDRFPEVPEATRKAARIRIEVEWTQGGETRRVPVNQWIQHAVHTKPMPDGPWVYGGSEFYDGKFVPEMTGDLVAIFVTRSALVNYPGDDNDNDDVWVCHSSRIPEQGTKVTLIIAPYPKPTDPRP